VGGLRACYTKHLHVNGWRLFGLHSVAESEYRFQKQACPTTEEILSQGLSASYPPMFHKAKEIYAFAALHYRLAPSASPPLLCQI
jgi:hypothetical protein